MILNLLSLAFFILLWLMAAKGLVDAAAPLSRRLSLVFSRPDQRRSHRARQSARRHSVSWSPAALS